MSIIRFIRRLFGMPTVSKKEAAGIALRHIGKTGWKISSVTDKLTGGSIYNVNLDHCWIVFYDDGYNMIKSSTIAVISKKDGKVIYYGSANDEG